MNDLIHYILSHLVLIENRNQHGNCLAHTEYVGNTCRCQTYHARDLRMAIERRNKELDAVRFTPQESARPTLPPPQKCFEVRQLVQSVRCPNCGIPPGGMCLFEGAKATEMIHLERIVDWLKSKKLDAQQVANLQSIDDRRAEMGLPPLEDAFAESERRHGSGPPEQPLIACTYCQKAIPPEEDEIYVRVGRENNRIHRACFPAWKER